MANQDDDDPFSCFGDDDSDSSSCDDGEDVTTDNSKKDDLLGIHATKSPSSGEIKETDDEDTDVIKGQRLVQAANARRANQDRVHVPHV